MECFFCHIAAGEPTRSDRQLDLRWVALADLPSLTWMPADEGLVAALAAMATGQSVAEDPSDGDAAPKTASTGEEPTGNGAGPVALDAALNTASAADTGDSTSGPGTDQEPAPGSAAAPRAKKRTAKSTKKRSGTRHAKRVKPDLLDGGRHLRPFRGRGRARAPPRRPSASPCRATSGPTPSPELLVRQRLRAAGYTGYRLQWGKAPGRPDIAFPGRKIALLYQRMLLASLSALPPERSPSATPSFGRQSSAATSSATARPWRRSRMPAGRSSPSGNASSSATRSTRQWSACSARSEPPGSRQRNSDPGRCQLRPENCV